MSLETQALIDWMAGSGVPHVVTATVGRFVSTADPCHPHASDSYHCAAGTGGPGLAVDFDGPDLNAIYAALAPLGPLSAELIHGTTQWRNGSLVAQYDFAPNILDHVHIAVPRGVIVSRKEGGAVAATPLHPLIAAIGTPTGKGYLLVAADGAVYAFGDAEYHGGLETDQQGNWRVRP